MCVTGNGATITLASTGTVGRIIRIGEWSEELDDIEDASLDQDVGDHMQYCPGTTINHDEVPIDVVFDPDALLELGVEELITITYPVPVGGSTGATRSGLGWLKKRTNAAAENNARMEGGYSLRFKGGSGGIGHTAAT